ncbi:MAG TPA: hypothetical protein PK714_10325 [Nitrosomonas sp.]|nr:hypothetical protein [Nitrosomonas sp.]
MMGLHDDTPSSGDVRWMGRVASDPDMGVIPERHLGLVMFDQH